MPIKGRTGALGGLERLTEPRRATKQAPLIAEAKDVSKCIEIKNGTIGNNAGTTHEAPSVFGGSPVSRQNPVIKSEIYQ